MVGSCAVLDILRDWKGDGILSLPFWLQVSRRPPSYDRAWGNFHSYPGIHNQSYCDSFYSDKSMPLWQVVKGLSPCLSSLFWVYLAHHTRGSQIWSLSSGQDEKLIFQNDQFSESQSSKEQGNKTILMMRMNTIKDFKSFIHRAGLLLDHQLSGYRLSALHYLLRFHLYQTKIYLIRSLKKMKEVRFLKVLPEC